MLSAWPLDSNRGLLAILAHKEQVYAFFTIKKYFSLFLC